MIYIDAKDGTTFMYEICIAFEGFYVDKNRNRGRLIASYGTLPFQSCVLKRHRKVVKGLYHILGCLSQKHSKPNLILGPLFAIIMDGYGLCGQFRHI